MASIKDLKRICEMQTLCADCPLNRNCSCMPGSLPDNADELVDKWVSEHPVKTYAMDFLEKFPNAQVNKYKTPKVCRSFIYGNSCPKYCTTVSGCDGCWNMEMRE